MSKTDNIIHLIEQDFELYKNSLGRNLAGQFRNELTLAATNAMGEFYGDYTPHKYKRHYYNFMEYAFRKYYSNPHNKIFRGGVELTPELLKDIYVESPDTVFEDVFMGGYHGPNEYAPKQMKKSPLEMVYEKQKEIYKNPMPYIERAKEKAKKENYKVLQFD